MLLLLRHCSSQRCYCYGVTARNATVATALQFATLLLLRHYGIAVRNAVVTAALWRCSSQRCYYYGAAALQLVHCCCCGVAMLQLATNVVVGATLRCCSS
jgi:ABC-type ATPase with predicted acetyltransferase domain